MNGKTKNVLNYQVSEFDCVPTNFINAITYLLGRTEMRADMIRTIHKETMDIPDVRRITKNGDTSFTQNYAHTIMELGFGGTSSKSIRKISAFLDRYREKGFDPLQCEYIGEKELTKARLQIEIKTGSVAILRVFIQKGVPHFIMINHITPKYVYAFDPYFRPETAFQKTDIIFVKSHPFEYNRKIPLTRIFSTAMKKDYAIGPVLERECVFIKIQK